MNTLSELFEEPPIAISSPTTGVLLIDFGRVAFGNLKLLIPPGIEGEVVVHFGENQVGGRVDRKPPGSVRYQKKSVPLEGEKGWRLVAPVADERNTGPQAIPLPPDWGVILPFRWVEIEGWPEGFPFRASGIHRRAAYLSDWDDTIAEFTSSDELLNRVWELCRYSIKATTFAGIYVDGDRERIPYEADAYLNQISHYACDNHPEIARLTFDHLMTAPTWPTEWAAHMVLMAHADWIYTGDLSWLAPRYDSLKAKLLPDREREDGLLISSEEERKLDIVDWPPAERDGYVFTSLNTVVNAFQYRALVLMAELAKALGKEAEHAQYEQRAAVLKEAFTREFFDEERGVYRDGAGTDHASQHASLFALAFGLVPEERRLRVIDLLKSKGMACSVYPAQYLLEALFEAGEAEYAIELMLAPGDRSWRHMVESGTTVTWEAWDNCYKPNQDWNHAWGAAPANLLPRFVLGVSPLEPGYRRVVVRPQLGQLAWARGSVPTIHGPIHVCVSRDEVGVLQCEVNAPECVEVRRMGSTLDI